MKKYYIEISSWNLLESFVTESISPFLFYQERDFGNNLSRYLSGEKERSFYLILSTNDLGSDYSICVDEELIDISVLLPVNGLKTVFTYPKTIYYRQGLVHFRFSTPELKDSLVAESQILLEVKCLEKYLSAFYVSKSKGKELKSLAKLENNLSFNFSSYVNYDNRLNKIKGAIIGYVRGLYTSSDKSNQTLQNELRALKNSFGGFNTQIMMSDTFDTKKDLVSHIKKCKTLYFNQIEQTDYFEVLIAQLYEIENLATMRANEIKMLNSDVRKKQKKELLEEKTAIENTRVEIEKLYNIYEVRHELDDIKSQERDNGYTNGKTRQYFKKGSAEYERKKQLKLIIEDFEKNNAEYKELSERLRVIEQKLNVDANMYDATISALFIRVSDILNELIKKAASVTSNDEIVLSNVLINNGNVSISNQSDNPELCYFNILLNLILNRNSETQLSEHAVIELLVNSAKIFKENPLSKSIKGEKIMNCLRTYWQYKDQKTDALIFPPKNMPIFQSIFSFFIKPFGFEQMERYMLLKNFQQKAYAFMLWGAWIGFADIPKTFTNVLYQNEKVSKLVDDKLKEF